MTKRFKTGLFIFRRDFRIVDNKGLDHLCNLCEKIVPIFIFTPEQVDSNKNVYKSTNAVQCMIESLYDLQKAIEKQGGKLHFFYGSNPVIVKMCIEHWGIDAVCCNRDISPYALQRDADIGALCAKKGVEFWQTGDYYLFEPGTIVSPGSKTVYQKFTPFYNVCLSRSKNIEKPLLGKIYRWTSGTQGALSNTLSLEEAFKRFVKKDNPSILIHGSRENALKLLKIDTKELKGYSKTHNILALPTSRLSAYIKFGCVSIREVYWEFHSIKDLTRQLIWRDFYASILYAFPHVLGKTMKPNYNKIRWKRNAKWLECWKKGETGFPVVDAAMRELNTTGYMHNRGRLIVASFLIKTLLQDWREGERYFATKLTDYDPASNNGNWQWVAGTGADSQPYFRIFNPFLQSKNFDPDAIYIKHWIPELKDVAEKDIHQWDKSYTKYHSIGYPKPIVDFEKQKEAALDLYRAVFQ
jgi:deoxyribodipyrimidine photo-lyase